MGTYTIPACITDAITAEGYRIDGESRAAIDEWWSWYTATNGWYDESESISTGRGRRTVKRHRSTLYPARAIAREWASVILTDSGTVVTSDDEAAADALQRWLDQSGFLTYAQRSVERAFALGTAALALTFDVREDGTTLGVERYDARQVVPLSWHGDQVDECAMCCRTFVRGRQYEQLSMHLMQGGTYHIVTRLFDAEGKPVHLDGIVEDFDTQGTCPPFCVIRPNIDNVRIDGSPYGQSIIEDAVGAVKTVDEAFDSLAREIRDTKVKTFMSDELFDVNPETGEPLPMSADASVVRMVMGHDVGSMISTFAPPIRMDALVQALDVALSQLGSKAGFGAQYFRYDVRDGLRTATQVNSDNQQFARSIAKHERTLQPALEGLLTTALKMLRVHCGEDVPEGATARVTFDDSIVADTASERSTALAEIAAMPDVPQLKADYLVRFHGMSRDEAERAAGSVLPPELGI